MSVAFDTPLSFEVGGQVEDLFVSELHVGEGIRSGGLDERHVELLMECADSWPPIVVWGEDLAVIDGCHRVEAARRLGRQRVVGLRFLGSPEEAFIEAIRRNVSHGLPLNVADRRRAAGRVLLRNPDWSDRRIASLCGLSDKTVGRIRRVGSLGMSADRRVGRDGKIRPIQPGEVRDRIRRALEENPAGSLRAIAEVAGASPETVRSVRARLQVSDSGPQEADQTPAVRKPPHATTMSVLSVFDPSEDRNAEKRSEKEWVTDQALSACGEFTEWFSSTNISEDWHHFLWTIPLGRVYEVVDEARRRAAVWTSFASLLEARTR
jgi:ParB-like chromosome segregation protein Spo0J